MNQDAKRIERYRGIVKFLDNAVKNIALYPPEHPSVKGVAKRGFDLLQEALEDAPVVSVRAAGGVLYLDDYLFLEPTSYSESFLKVLGAFGVDGLVFRKGVTEEEFLGLAGILKSRERGREVFHRLSEREGLTHIGLQGEGPPPEEGGVPAVSPHARPDALSGMERIFVQAREGGVPSLREAEEIVDVLIMDVAAHGPFAFFHPDGMDRGSRIFRHFVNVGILSILLARKGGLDEGDVRMAALAGLLHDVGKAKVLPVIFRKPGALTPRESEAMRLHPIRSAEVTRRMGAPEEVSAAVEAHHRHHDGSGYPVLEGRESVPALARLVSVANFFDAAVMVLPFRRPVNPAEAMDRLGRGRGHRFDPVYVDALFALLGPFPPGSVVRLSSGEIGIVSGPGDCRGKPAVRMVLDRDGEPFGSRRVLDLDGPDAAGRIVVGDVDPVLFDIQTVFGTGVPG